MAKLLTQAGVIHYEWQLVLGRTLQPSLKLQAGEYEFRDPASVWKVLERLGRGDVYFYEVTFPEGSNLFDMAAIIDRNGAIGRSQFIAAARNPQLIKDLDPRAPTLEGYLFPSTYRLTHATSAEQLCKLMTDQFRKHWKQAAGNLRVDVHDTTTLASLVEKETGVAADRATVASVYANRIRKQMKLECDPTTIYAAILDDRYRGVIFKSDLESTNPYNTYKHAGMPPGPIANPGLASLRAALQPAQTDFLFFVANPDGSGGHIFSKNLADHNKAVKAYRDAQQKKPVQARKTR